MKRFILISIIIVSFPVFLFAQKIVITQDTAKLLTHQFNLPRELSLPDTFSFNPGDTIPNHLWEKFRKGLAESDIKSFKSTIDQMPVVVPPDYNFSMIVNKPDSTVQYYIRNLNTGETKIYPPKNLTKPKQ